MLYSFSHIKHVLIPLHPQALTVSIAKQYFQWQLKKKNLENPERFQIENRSSIYRSQLTFVTRVEIHFFVQTNYIKKVGHLFVISFEFLFAWSWFIQARNLDRDNCKRNRRNFGDSNRCRRTLDIAPNVRESICGAANGPDQSLPIALRHNPRKGQRRSDSPNNASVFLSVDLHRKLHT